MMLILLAVIGTIVGLWILKIVKQARKEEIKAEVQPEVVVVAKSKAVKKTTGKKPAKKSN